MNASSTAGAGGNLISKGISKTRSKVVWAVHKKLYPTWLDIQCLTARESLDYRLQCPVVIFCFTPFQRLGRLCHSRDRRNSYKLHGGSSDSNFIPGINFYILNYWNKNSVPALQLTRVSFEETTLGDENKCILQRIATQTLKLVN